MAINNSLLDSLISIGVEPGRNIFVHANLGLINFEKNEKPYVAKLILDSLIQAVGRGGTVLLPAFTYSFGLDKVFRPKSDDGLNKMGLLSLEAFGRLDSYRSVDPMFSILGIGPNAKYFLDLDSKSSHGPGSTFNKLVSSDVTVLAIGTGFGTTLIHEIEFGLDVSYRFMKTFEGTIEYEPNSLEKEKWTAFVNRREMKDSDADFTRLNLELRHEDFAKRIKFGRGEIIAYSVKNLRDFLGNKLSKDKWYLTKRGSYSK